MVGSDVVSPQIQVKVPLLSLDHSVGLGLTQYVSSSGENLGFLVSLAAWEDVFHHSSVRDQHEPILSFLTLELVVNNNFV